MGAHRQIDGKLSILNLNCQCINSKSDKKLFMEGINNNSMPISVITLQETWADNETDMNLLLLYKSIIYIPPGSASLIQFFTVFSFAIIFIVVNTVYTYILYTVTVAYNHVRASIQRVTFHQSPYESMYMYIVNMQFVSPII